MTDALADDEPITLAEACKLFPRAKTTVSTLRAEASRGRLVIFRYGKRDCTTPKDMQEMIRRCRDEDVRRRDSTSTKTGANGLSETVRTASALASLKRTVQELKGSSPNISVTSTNHKTAPTP